MTLRIKIILTHKVRKERPSPRRMGKVTNWAIFVCIAVYALTGLFGSLQYHDETNPNILKNFLKDQSKNGNGSGQNMILLLSFVAMALTIVMAFPLVVFPCRYTVDVMLFHDAEPNWCRHFVLTAVICGCTLLVSLFVPNISVVFQLMGGTTSAFVCFVLPAAFAIHLAREQDSQCKDKLKEGNDRANYQSIPNGESSDNQGLKSILINRTDGPTQIRRISQCEVYGSWALATMGVVVGIVSTSVTIYNLVVTE